MPQRLRYRSAVILAHRLSAFVRSPDPAKARLQPRVELALGLILAELDGRHIRYDVPFVLRGAEAIAAALDAGQGVLLAGFHEVLTLVAPRHFHDQSINLKILSAQRRTMPGFGEPAAIIPANATALFAIGRHWAAGGLLVAAIDRERPAPGYVECDTARGPIYVAKNILDFARRSGATVLFGHTELLKNGLVQISIEKPSETASAECLALSFGKFISRSLER